METQELTVKEILQRLVFGSEMRVTEVFGDNAGDVLYEGPFNNSMLYDPAWESILKRAVTELCVQTNTFVIGVR